MGAENEFRLVILHVKAGTIKEAFNKMGLDILQSNPYIIGTILEAVLAIDMLLY